MNRIMSYIRGSCELTVYGASPEGCINRLTAERIVFWRVVYVDEMHLRITVLKKHQAQAEKLITSCFCQVESCKEQGLLLHLKKLRPRPALILSMALALFFSFFLQGYVWVLTVEGNVRLHEEEILRELEQQGIGFGTKGSTIDSQLTKHRMLLALPELSWLAVNRSGGKLTVLVTERPEPPNPDKNGEANLIATNHGVITDYNILEGMKLINRGDTVQKGQLLVSGYEDYGLMVRRVRAEGEIYAQTWHKGTLVMPAVRKEKVYTGKMWKETYLIIGRKRIKISGSSSNLGTTCDRITNVKKARLKNYAFPITVEMVTYREYSIEEALILPEEARELLRQGWARRLKKIMVAGKIEKTEERFSCHDGLYILYAESTCNEMIARQVTLAEGETNDGTNH